MSRQNINLYWWYSFLQLSTSCEVELSTHKLFTDECQIVKMSAEIDNVVRKPTRAAEMSTTIIEGNSWFTGELNSDAKKFGFKTKAKF